MANVWPLVSGWRILSMLGFSTSAFMVPLTAVAWGGLACFAASPEEILHTIRLFGVTQLFVANMQLQGLIDAQAGGYEPCPSLRMINVSGSRIPSGLLMRTRAQLCNNVIISYGSTECGLVATVETAAGYAMPWARVEAVDENGTVLAQGEAGRLRVSSDEMAEYVADRPDDSNPAPDGWFYPGDVGSVRADGLVMITGRSAELINRGGSIVAPELVEEVLVAKAEIAQAAVFGVTNDKGFEEIWAAVVPRQPYRDEEVLQFCRQRLVEKTPDVLITVDAIPRTDNGKVMRNRLREIAVQRRKGNMARI
jgi:long-chain acyl-CoA synthetase